MNTTKNIISVVSHNNFQTLDLALQAAGTAIALVDKVPPKLKSLADQLIRSAASSIASYWYSVIDPTRRHNGI